MNEIKTKNGELKFPAFLPDATYGSVRSTSFKDLKDIGTQGVVTTTLHIEKVFGSQNINKLGGINKFFSFDRPILTDSGGWQVFSLINSKRPGKKYGHVSELGCTFFDDNTGKTILLSPESSIQIQINLDSDIITVLDYPILGDAPLVERKECIRINTQWAKRSINQLNKLNDTKGCERPLIGCVIQGGDDFKLRKQSASELAEIGFDLFNFGGIPMRSEVTWKTNSKQNFYHEMLSFVSELIPRGKIKYAMGVGQPDDIAFCVQEGWDMFDTVLPTRNARHGYLYVSEGQGDETKSVKIKNSKNEFKTFAYDILRLKNSRYVLSEDCVDNSCDCETCKNVSRAYLRHLIRINEPAGFRLATIHNLRFYNQWMFALRGFLH